MKTIEEKARAYDEALEYAMIYYKEGNEDMKMMMKTCFPTLVEESEDEKIRKWIVDDITFNMNNEPLNNSEYRKKAEKAIAWLEKQGEHANFRNKIQVGDKVTRNEDGVLVNLSQLRRVAKPSEKQGEQKPADKVEPKFKVGDKIRRKTPSSFDKDMQVARIEKDYYVCNHIGKFSSEVVPFSKQSSYELVEPKQGWRAEEEAVLDALIRRLKGEDIYVSPHLAVECLESLKGRVLPKQEWSEDDEQHIDSLLKRLDALCRNKFERTRFAISEDRDWLKSLRPQNRWKPSDGDIIILEKVIKGELEPKVFQATLQGILEQLKKLKEG